MFRLHSLMARLAMVAIAWCLCPANLPATERPNILWLSCEDISPHLGCYGYPNAVTPHVDRLAASGIRYANAFVCAGVCAPCRSTIITGMYQTSIGTHHMRCKAELPGHIKPFTTWLRAAGYYCTNNSKTDYQFNAPANTWDESSGKAHWKHRPDPRQPFFAVFNYGGCHESGIANDSKYQSVTEGQIKQSRDTASQSLPPYYPNTPVVREDWARYYDVITAMDRWVGEQLKELEEAGLAEDTIVIYWSDHGVGLPRAKRWLYDSGMKVPLIVHVPQKYAGFATQPNGTVNDELVSLIDLGPTVLNLAGLDVPDHMQGRAFLGADLSPQRDYVYGARDRMDERYDIIRAVRDKRYKYIRNYEPYKTYYQYMNTPEKGRLMQEIRRLQAEGTPPPFVDRFLRPTKATEELYDTQADPHELFNLANSKAHGAILSRMRQAHMDWVIETRDLGLIPEAELTARRREAGSEWAILNGPQGLARMTAIRDVASASLEGRQKLDYLIEALRSSEPAVRYWAANGLGNIGPKAASATKDLTTLLSDSSDNVKVAAARALCVFKKNENQALNTLAGVLDNGSQWARLHAAIVLDEMDDQARPVLEAMRKNKAYREGMVAKGKYTVRVLNRALNDLDGTELTVP